MHIFFLLFLSFLRIMIYSMPFNLGWRHTEHHYYYIYVIIQCYYINVHVCLYMCYKILKPFFWCLKTILFCLKPHNDLWINCAYPFSHRAYKKCIMTVQQFFKIKKVWFKHDPKPSKSMSCLKSASTIIGSLVVDVPYHVTCSYETFAMKSTLLISLSSSEHNWSSITHWKFWAFHPTSRIACFYESRSLWTLWKMSVARGPQL